MLEPWFELKACAPTGDAMNKTAQQCARYLRNVPYLRSGLVLNFPDKANRISRSCCVLERPREHD